MTDPTQKRGRRSARSVTVVMHPDPSPASESERPPKLKSDSRPPFLLDFYPLEDARSTRLSQFFEALRAGRFTTTKCPKDGLLWPPRVACPRCHTETLEWAEVPTRGHIYAFSPVLVGAPLGMEGELPFVVGLVDLEGTKLRLFGRIVGTPWTECRIGQPVRVEPYSIDDGRVFFRFRTTGR